MNITIETEVRNVRLEWLILQALVRSEIEQGETEALDHQMARFEDAVAKLESMVRAA